MKRGVASGDCLLWVGLYNYRYEKKRITYGKRKKEMTEIKRGPKA